VALNSILLNAGWSFFVGGGDLNSISISNSSPSFIRRGIGGGLKI